MAGRAFLLNQAEGYTQARGSTIRIEFTDEGISFHAGCNNHAGSYHIDGETLVVSVPGLVASLMACAPSLDAQDTWLREFLLERPTFQLNGNTLTLKSNDATLTFLDRTVADPDRPLVGQAWMIDTLIAGEAASSVSASKPSIRFEPDGRVVVDTGCNMGNGKYEVASAQVTFGPMAVTRRACLSDDLVKTENHVLQIVREGAATFRIEASRLTIERSDGTAIKAVAQ